MSCFGDRVPWNKFRKEEDPKEKLITQNMKDWRKKQTHKLKEMKAENREGNTNKNKLKKRKLENVQERNMKKAIKRNTNLKRDR